MSFFFPNKMCSTVKSWHLNVRADVKLKTGIIFKCGYLPSNILWLPETKLAGQSGDFGDLDQFLGGQILST